MNWQLTATAGPRRGESWILGSRPVTLGRCFSCDIIVDDPTVSRRHCQISVENGGVLFRDLGSRNVSLVNGDAVDECNLLSGDEVRLGSSAFLLTRSASTGSVPNPGLPGRQASTVSLSEAILGPGMVAGTSAASYPGSIREIVQLFRFGRKLALGSSPASFATICLDQMRELFPGPRVCAVYCQHGSGSSWHPVDFKPPEALQTQVNQAMQWSEPSIQHRKWNPFAFHRPLAACVAPISATGRCRGALAVYSTTRGDILDSSDLARLAALAEAAAPYLLLQNADHEGTGPDPALMILAPPLSSGVHARIDSVLASGGHTLITGQEQTGDRLAAQLIHAQSISSKGELVTADCRLIAGAGFINALSGEGAPLKNGDGAAGGGLLERARGGTLVLRNVEALTLENQKALLSILERGTYRRSGIGPEHPLDTRIVATSNADLDERTRQGGFRAELFAFLGRERVHIAPLDHAAAEEQAAAGLYARAIASVGSPRRSNQSANPDDAGLTDSGRMLRSKIVEAMGREGSRTGENRDRHLERHRHTPHDAEVEALENAERTLIRAVLARCDGDMARAARVFGLPPGALHQLMAQPEDATPREV